MVVTRAREDIKIVLGERGIHRDDLDRTGLEDAILRPRGWSHEAWKMFTEKRFTEAEADEIVQAIIDEAEARADKENVAVSSLSFHLLVG